MRVPRAGRFSSRTGPLIALLERGFVETGQRAHPRERFRPGYPVKLSEEGQDRLRPRVPLVGYVEMVADGLVTVWEAPGRRSEYHQDFIEFDASRPMARRLTKPIRCCLCRLQIEPKEFSIATRKGITHQMCGAAE